MFCALSFRFLIFPVSRYIQTIMQPTIRFSKVLLRSCYAFGRSTHSTTLSNFAAIATLSRALCTEASTGAGTGRMSDLSGLGPKRFYEKVGVDSSNNSNSNKSSTLHIVTVDDKPVKTPRRHVLSTPSRLFSIAVAEEWDEQVDRIRPSSMPLTGLACAALDVIPEYRQRMEKSILRYLHTDTVCIRPDTPKELVDHQNEIFEPIIQHVKNECNSDVNVVRGGLAAQQGKHIEDWLTNIIQGLDDWSLVAMDSATGSAKSVLVAIALRNGCIDAEKAVKAARSEELWQSKVWGVVEGGHDLDDADVTVRIGAADMVFRFVDKDRQAFEKASNPVNSKPS